MRHEKIIKKLMEEPTVDCFLKPIQRTGIKHSVGKVILQTYIYESHSTYVPIQTKVILCFRNILIFNG